MSRSSSPGAGGWAVGIDIGGTKIAAGVVDLDTGDVAHDLRVPTPVSSGGEAVLALTLVIFRTSKYWVFYEGGESR